MAMDVSHPGLYSQGERFYTLPAKFAQNLARNPRPKQVSVCFWFDRMVIFGCLIVALNGPTPHTNAGRSGNACLCINQLCVEA